MITREERMRTISFTILRTHVELGESAIALFLTLLLALSITGINMTFTGYKDKIILQNGDLAMYRIDGTSWTVIYISVSSSQPVSVCITDENGLQMLKTGSGMCLFLEEHVTHVTKIWRFPVNGPLYLIVIPEEGKPSVSLNLEVRSLMGTW